MDEPIFEPLARLLRFYKGFSYFPKNKRVTLVDLGCGPRLRYLRFVLNQGVLLKKYIGVDPLIETSIDASIFPIPVEIVKKPVVKRLPLDDEIANVVVGHAFLEHIDHPREITEDALRILKPGGVAIFTAPSLRGKGVLEFLSYKLNLISKREIDEHKQYFEKESMLSLISSHENVDVQHEYFELKHNNLLVITKKK